MVDTDLDSGLIRADRPKLGRGLVHLSSFDVFEDQLRHEDYV